MNHIRTIVIADDEAHVRHILSLKLQAGGYQVHVACDGEEAHALVRQHKPDLVVTDFEMPRMRGDELGVALQSDPQTAGTPLIMLTARGHCLAAERLREANVVLIMDKPFSITALMRQIKERFEHGSPIAREDAA